MKPFNYYFPMPQKKVIISIRKALKSLETKYPIFVGVKVSPKNASPQAQQYPKQITVTNNGFNTLENNLLREYGFGVYVTTTDFETHEELCELFDGVLTTISGNGIKYIEVESVLDIEDETEGTFTRLFNLNVLIGAEQFN